MEARLEGLVAIVTGAGTGIGEAVARRLHATGCIVALLGRRTELLANLAEQLGDRTITVACDVCSASSVASSVKEVESNFGRLDILVNNAGVFHPMPFSDLTVEVVDATLNTNLRGAILMARECWPHLAKAKGQLVNISSIAGTRPFKGSAVYCASKFGMNGLSEVLALEGKERGIRVFSVCPGSVDTPIWRSREPEEITDKMMRAEDVAETVGWLLESPRRLEFDSVVVSNFVSPWE